MHRNWTAVAFAASGLAFILYPALRGYGDQTSGAEATAFARPEWLVAHQLGIVAFIALTIGLSSLNRTAYRWSLVAAAGLLPYYGAEAYGLHALGAAARTGREIDAASIADSFRYEPIALTSFAVGLLALAITAIPLLQQLRTHASAAYHTGAALTAIGLVTYLPQFFAPGWVRIAHGAVLAAGLLVIATQVARERAPLQRHTGRFEAAISAA